MKTLPESRIKNNVIYTLIERNDIAAVCSLQYPDSDKIIGYDVFLIKQQEAGEFNGIKFEEKERFPNDTAFGVWAWSFSKLESAKAKYAAVLNPCIPVKRLSITKKENAGWQSSVYKKQESDSPVGWNETRSTCLEIDKRRCQSCDSRKNLTVHHIIPRDIGGLTVLDNLITLCNDCHNEIEPLQLNRTQIIGFKDNTPTKPEKPLPIGLDWHSWVYGGYKNPINI